MLARASNFRRLLQRHSASKNLLDKVRRVVENNGFFGKAYFKANITAARGVPFGNYIIVVFPGQPPRHFCDQVPRACLQVPPINVDRERIAVRITVGIIP